MQRKPFRYVLWGGAAVAVAAGLFFAFRPQPVPVDLGTVAENRLIVSVGDEGRTEVREVYRIAAPLAGRLLRVEGEVGDAVVGGDTEIARIEPAAPVLLDVRTEKEARASLDAAHARLDLALAEWDRAKADVRFADTELDRARALFARGTIARQKLDAAEREARVAAANLSTTRAQLDQRTHELEFAKARLLSPAEAMTTAGDCACLVLRSPVDGRILQILQESETPVAAGATIAEVGDPRDLQVVVDLLSEDAVAVESGLPARVEDWGGPPLNAVVRRVEPFGYTKVSALGIDEQRVDVILDLVDPPDAWSRLGHGYRVDVRILLHDAEALTVPLAAVFRDGDAWAAFVAADGRAGKRAIELGRRNTEHAEVLDGLAAGERVILYPTEDVVDGVRVRAR